MRRILNTIGRAVFSEITAVFVIALIALNFVLMMDKLLRLTRLLSSVGVSAADMLRIIILIQPALFIFTTPLAFLIAVLITYGRLNIDNELTAMRACGMSFPEITAPVRLFGLICLFVTAIFSFYVAPLGSTRLRETVAQVITKRAPYAIEEAAFSTAFPSMMIHVSQKPSRGNLRDVFLYDERDAAHPLILYAKSGHIYAGKEQPVLELQDGIIHIANTTGASTEITFKKYSFAVPLAPKDTVRKMAEFTPFELLGEAKNAGKGRIPILLEFHRRLTFPLLCMLITLLAPPLSLLAGKTGRFGGLTIGLAVFAIYYAGLIWGERLAIAGIIPHYVAGWAPTVFVALASYAAFRQAGSR